MTSELPSPTFLCTLLALRCLRVAALTFRFIVDALRCNSNVHQAYFWLSELQDWHHQVRVENDVLQRSDQLVIRHRGTMAPVAQKSSPASDL